MGEKTDMLGFFSLLKTNMYSSYNIDIEREKICPFLKCKIELIHHTFSFVGTSHNCPLLRRFGGRQIKPSDLPKKDMICLHINYYKLNKKSINFDF